MRAVTIDEEDLDELIYRLRPDDLDERIIRGWFELKVEGKI